MLMAASYLSSWTVFQRMGGAGGAIGKAIARAAMATCICVPESPSRRSAWRRLVMPPQRKGDSSFAAEEVLQNNNRPAHNVYGLARKLSQFLKGELLRI